jgi:hypothetical protein
MSKRSDRRAAERETNKLAQQQLRQPSPAVAQIPESLNPATPVSDVPVPAVATTTTSEAQIAANRANAQLSTGPTTEEGKAISARNNTRHGLAGDSDADNFRVLVTEKQSHYDQRLADFRHEWKPITATEQDLVNRMVMHSWLRKRALHLQETLFDAQTGEVSDIKKFDLYRRYETSHERGFNKALADIQRLRAFQLRQQNGFESQRRKNAEHELKMRRLKCQDEAAQLKIAAATARLNRISKSTPVENHHPAA